MIQLAGVLWLGIWVLAVASPLQLGATAANTILVPVAGLALFTAFLGRRNPRAARGLAVIAALIVGTLVVRATNESRPARINDGTPLTVVSHNVLFRGGSPNATIRMLRQQNADVILLQEVTPDWVGRLKRAKLLPYHVFAPHRGTHGMAVLSRVPLTRPKLWRNDSGRVIGQCVDLKGPKSVRGSGICHVHLASPSGAVTQSEHPVRAAIALERNARLRERQWTRLAREMKDRHDPILIGGDFNTLPEEPWLIEARHEWVDAARGLGLRQATWPRIAASAHRPPWPLGVVARQGPWFRIDYLLVSPSVGLNDATRLAGGGSDHLAVRATLTLP
ncbi:MAG: endonuclease/exonuclease/phosphatase family protein [Myxococcota bacterium]